MSLSYKERALRCLKTNRADLNYEPRPSASNPAAFDGTLLLYYKVYDQNLAPVRKEVTYAHSLDELYYMAIDNADRLGTLDLLFTINPKFSARSMTLRDLILTAFVGTSDGRVTSMLVCPWLGETAYDLDTTLYATVMSDLLRNTRDTPLRIAVNATMKKWTQMSKLGFFGGSAKTDSKLIDLNNRVNCGQIVDLRNDPEGSVRYSQKALDSMKAAKSGKSVAPEGTTALSNGALAGSATEPASDAPGASHQLEYDDSGPSPSDPIAILHARQSAATQSQQAPLDPTTDQEHSEHRAPIALATEEIIRGSHSPKPDASVVDVSSISAPLQAARLEDKTTSESDKMAVESSESNPVFDSLHKNDSLGNKEAANLVPTGVASNDVQDSALEETSHGTGTTRQSAKTHTTIAADDEEASLAPPLPRDHTF